MWISVLGWRWGEEYLLATAIRKDVFAEFTKLSVLSVMTSKRTDTRLVFCNRKLMRTDIFFTRTNKPIFNFVNLDICGVKHQSINVFMG